MPFTSRPFVGGAMRSREPEEPDGDENPEVEATEDLHHCPCGLLIVTRADAPQRLSGVVRLVDSANVSHPGGTVGTIDIRNRYSILPGSPSASRAGARGRGTTSARRGEHEQARRSGTVLHQRSTTAPVGEHPQRAKMIPATMASSKR